MVSIGGWSVEGAARGRAWGRGREKDGGGVTREREEEREILISFSF